MKEKYRLILLLILLTGQISCVSDSYKQEAYTQVEQNIDSDTTVVSMNQEAINYTDTLSKIEDTVKREPIILDYLQRDSLVKDWYFDLLGIKESNLTLESHKTPKQNIYSQDVMDTIEVLSYKNSEITIYESPVGSGPALERSQINDSEIILEGGLHTGLDRNVVEKILGAEFDNDSLEVGNLENTTVFDLIFSDNRLKEISFRGFFE